MSTEQNPQVDESSDIPMDVHVASMKAPGHAFSVFTIAKVPNLALDGRRSTEDPVRRIGAQSAPDCLESTRSAGGRSVPSSSDAHLCRTPAGDRHKTACRGVIMSELPKAAAPPVPRFYSVAEVARMFGMSSMTLYRAIADGGFPAVRVRGRLTIPAQAIEQMAEAAVADRTVVDASNWVVEGVTSR